MAAIKPSVLVLPLQISLQMHQTFGSKYLVDVLSKLGISSSHAQVQKFERSAAVNQGTDLPPKQPGQLPKHITDNVDHDLCTLDGTMAFHEMGIIATVIP